MPAIMSRNGPASRPGVRRIVSASAIVSGADKGRDDGAAAPVVVEQGAQLRLDGAELRYSSFGALSASTPSTVSSSLCTTRRWPARSAAASGT